MRLQSYDCSLLLAVFLWLIVAATGIAADLITSPPTPTVFETDVRAILKTHCWQCHGEEEKPEGALDARLATFLLKGGDTGPAVVPGNHAESLLYKRIVTGEMPPGKVKLSSREVDIIARWIDGGAVVVNPEPESLAPGDIFTNQDRQHWSFQPVKRPPLPAVARPELVRTPIDAFLLSELENRELSFGAEADRATLIRRLSFDLTGLPPSPEDVDRFVQDPSGDAYEQLVERLLTLPQYGERWARHWLDIVGYTDSDGYTSLDTERKWAWKYRDYVIRSLNADKPWNQFIVEQIGGDELLSPPYKNLTPEQADLLVATGFLRMGPDGTGDATADQNLARNDVIAETIKITSTSLLGLTVGCAQCHSHRFDPISHVDYHRLRAIFEPAYDCQNWRGPEARLTSLWSDETQGIATAIDQEYNDIEKQRVEALDQLVKETFAKELARLPAELQPLARAARETTAKDRTPEQLQLIKEYPFLNVDSGSVYLYLPDRLTEFTKIWDEKKAANRARRPGEDYAHCLTEVPGQMPVTKLFFRGDFNQPRQEVPPGVLSILNTANLVIPNDDPAIPTSGRRLAFARHLTDGQHPLVGRVLVNRFWMHHFGKGIVATPSDFGFAGERPSHPQLLDWLADEFVQSGWKLKSLHRLIVLSTAYRQQSIRQPSANQIDPDNRLLARFPVLRLDAETIRDSLLAVSGRLNLKLYGAPVSVTPDEVGQIVLGPDNRDAAGYRSIKALPLGEEEFRRSLYVKARRTMPLSMMEPFDVPVMSPNCQLRASSTVAPQALFMMNNTIVSTEADLIAERVIREAGPATDDQFRRAWKLVIGRDPDESDREAGIQFLVAATPTGDGTLSEVVEPAAKLADERLRLAHFCHALLCSNAFLYVD